MRGTRRQEAPGQGCPRPAGTPAGIHGIFTFRWPCPFISSRVTPVALRSGFVHRVVACRAWSGGVGRCRVGVMTDPDPINVIFLRDVDHGGSADQLAITADALARFVSAATQSVDIAIYDFRLSDPSATDTVVGALRTAAARGVTVRIGYDAGKPARADFATFSAWEADPAPPGTAQWVTEYFSDTAVETLAIVGGHQLMHSKYIVRDAGTDGACVWTGSTNFTDAAWTRQENNIITIADQQTSTAYCADFDDSEPPRVR
jgi:phosphatidylserine/phosphatidylglycerophosphate/cardiolipin synthase-like enzyme